MPYGLQPNASFFHQHFVALILLAHSVNNKMKNGFNPSKVVKIRGIGVHNLTQQTKWSLHQGMLTTRFVIIPYFKEMC